MLRRNDYNREPSAEWLSNKENHRRIGLWVTDIPKQREISWELLKELLNHNDITPRLVAMIIRSLGDLGRGGRVSWKTLPNEFKLILMNALEHQAQNMNATDVSNSLWGLARLKTSWDKLAHTLQERLLEALADNTKDPSNIKPREISISLWAIQRLQISWDTFQTVLKNQLLEAINYNTSAMNAQNIANTLLTLGNLNIPLTSELQEQLLTALSDKIEHMNPIEVANSLRALVRLNLSREEITTELQEHLRIQFSKIKCLSTQDQSECLQAMEHFGLYPDELHHLSQQQPTELSNGILITDFAHHLIAVEPTEASRSSRKSRFWTPSESNSNTSSERKKPRTDEPAVSSMQFSS